MMYVEVWGPGGAHGEACISRNDPYNGWVAQTLNSVLHYIWNPSAGIPGTCLRRIDAAATEVLLACMLQGESM